VSSQGRDPARGRGKVTLNIFGIGLLELVVIMAIALIVLGPAKTMNMAKDAGKMLGEMRRSLGDLSKAINEETADIGTGDNDEPGVASEDPPREER